MDKTYENLIVSFEEGVAVLTINRPKALNALNDRTLDEMLQALEEVEADPRHRVLLVTGSGDRAFVAGADIRELKDLDEKSGQAAARKGQSLLSRLQGSRLFVIAGVNGFALGGGLELALACDIRIASDKAVFGLPEVGLGIIPGYGGTQRLSRLVGRGQALELVATGRKIDAAYALRIGLVNQVVPAAELLDTCRRIAGEVLANAPIAVTAAKRAIHQGLDQSLEAGLALEAAQFGSLFNTRDVTEGMNAFVEKRRPNFQGS
ncbi:MAG: enoyl-CoA hydratase/isomerase family protein [Armatimonadetes bacterium]|nr:enoyl-CoA hydratase/isomerase family protein [Armatimonadota bacterium]